MGLQFPNQGKEQDTQSSICDLFSAYKEQDKLLRELESMGESIGKAIAIREISSDYRKRILARLMDPLIRAGESVAGAEVKARSMKQYDEAMAEHEKDFSWAEEKLARREWLKVSLEALRSKISTQRALIELK